MKVHLRMTGCRLNQSEIDLMARQFEAQGHQITDEADQADWFVVNTCAVTQQATSSSRKLIRELHRANQGAEITVTGCYAQISPEEVQVIPGVTRIIDNIGKDTLVEQLTGKPAESFDYEPISRDGRISRTRAFVKVQDGCDNACTFCVTTIARGAGRSRPMQDILDEIRYLEAAGYQEAVLTGVHLGSYGHDLGQSDGLFQLAQAILRETAIPRLRLSSLEPWDLSEGFFSLWQDPRVCRHLHLPLQSGSDRTLKRMLRRTNQANFSALVSAAREAVPEICITTDVIVGFPGETESEFSESYAFIEAMDFAGLHVFPYSKRPGTAAARMRNHVRDEVKKDRSARLIALSKAGEGRFAQRFIGQTFPVLWEQIAGVTQEGFMNVGYTDHYIRVRCIHPRVLTNQILPALLLQYTDHQMQVLPMIEEG
ncbi:MAG: tRNA (N(6)-L-threonylcarbamoyladenosine(37)-C(2))-methylthiotransferase MtaB [Anaerolineae bacterium]|nr:tRNA (N(6)-L-threonylcarbamoyladenosine(37)-C(2))-methylthiotransferase MtaB [Anaerolineae bacterium]